MYFHILRLGDWVMEIAVIGWGSLIWCPGSLAIKTAWHPDGPNLPLEFARISRDCRLTLVIHPESKPQTTYWALSDFENLKRARKNLAEREGCGCERICYVTAEGVKCEHKNAGHEWIADKVKAWIADRKESVSGAVWTGLPSNWKHRKCKEFTAKDAVNYLTCLREVDPRAFERAREYVRNAPPQTDTKVRNLLRAKGSQWSDNPLPKVLFV